MEVGEKARQAAKRGSAERLAGGRKRRKRPGIMLVFSLQKA
jgi:hypothetical protein